MVYGSRMNRDANLNALTLKKQQLDRLRPLPDALLRNLDDWFRVELTYASNAIKATRSPVARPRWSLKKD